MTVSPEVKIRQAVERRIAEAVIDSALALGYTIDVDDTEEITLKKSSDKAAILAAMFTTDEDYLHLRLGKKRGWVRFIYGNDGWDVINDYTNLEDDVMKPVNALIEKIEAGEFQITV